MNERIRELADEAGLYVDLNGTPWPRAMSAEDCEAAYKKFAESIVKKCMDVAKYHTPDTEECEHTWLIHDKIQKYFGVEE